MAVTRAVHTVLFGAPFPPATAALYLGGTATPWWCTTMPRAVTRAVPPLAISSCFFVGALSSSRLGLLASLLSYQHLLQCLLLSVDHFLHVPNLVQVRVASY
jgi:hypothetical protein